MKGGGSLLKLSAYYSLLLLLWLLPCDWKGQVKCLYIWNWIITEFFHKQYNFTTQTIRDICNIITNNSVCNNSVFSHQEQTQQLLKLFCHFPFYLHSVIDWLIWKKKLKNFNLSCRFSLQEETIITKFTPCLCTFTHKPGLRAAAVDLRLLTSS